MTDTEAVHEFAAALRGSWDDAPGLLEQLAEVVDRTGRGHPGRPRKTHPEPDATPAPDPLED